GIPDAPPRPIRPSAGRRSIWATARLTLPTTTTSPATPTIRSIRVTGAGEETGDRGGEAGVADGGRDGDTVMASALTAGAGGAVTGDAPSAGAWARGAWARCCTAAATWVTTILTTTPATRVSTTTRSRLQWTTAEQRRFHRPLTLC